MKKIESIEHVWSLICSLSVIDSETNNLSLFNLIERVTIPVPPALLEKVKADGKKGFVSPFNFEVISRFKKRNDDKTVVFDLRLRVINPEGRIIHASERKVAMQEKIKNMRVRTRFNTIPVEKSGEYAVAVDIKEVGDTNYIEVARIPLEVVVEVVKGNEEAAKKV